MSEFAEHDVEKVSTPPLVHDATQPTDPAADDDDAGPKTGALVAVVGTPFDGGVPTFDAALGYCVWGLSPASTTPIYIEDGMGGYLGIYDNDGNPVVVSD